jgi:hypothetical protein
MTVRTVFKMILVKEEERERARERERERRGEKVGQTKEGSTGK